MEGGFGARVALFRRRKGLSQRALADAVGRSESWMSQVERDILPVGRLSVLHSLAAALDTSIYDLEPADLAPPPESPAEQAERAPVEALAGLRAVLIGHPHLDRLLVAGDPEAGDPEAGDAPAHATTAAAGTTGGAGTDREALARSIDEAWDAARRWQLADLGRRLAVLLPHLEASARDGAGADVAPLVARAYRAAAAAFAYAGEADAAWVAADRAMAAAESAGDPLGVVAALYRMAHAFVRVGRLEQAEDVLGAALGALEPRVDDTPGASVLAMTGALHLLTGVVAAREGQRTRAHDHIEAARSLAGRVAEEPGTGDVYETEFCQANVEAHAVAVAVELGDAGMAVDTARRVDTSALSPERHARLLVDVGRAQTQRRQVELATQALLDAEELAPELVAGHPSVREAVRQLTEQAPDAGESLRALAHRTSAFPP